MSDYKRNPRGARRARKSLSRKALVVLSLMLVLVMAAVGGTVAWLTVETTAVTNTFTVGDIDITLDESTGTDYKIIPGVDLDKDPTVTVKKGSEACWVFVKVEEEYWPENDKISYTINTVAEGGAWTALTGYPGVYYIEQSDLTNATSDVEYNVLKGNKVTVSEGLTKTEVGNINEALAANNGKFTLKFTAYAIQKEKFSTAEAAWLELNPPASGT